MSTAARNAERIAARHATTARLLAAYRASPTWGNRIAWLDSTLWEDAAPAPTMLTHDVYQG